ncbi:hypothetical protein B0F87_1049 [Methylobacter tundripaludum]|uniref:Uncharacterized protein n=1 Tax=Methylobacter tundripaludum TaxID=173365 RepID=A0A2S6HEN6_9GAMM|nr:hypothetical protein [Methylobacter tundripaludum]PPK75922.1 hypothetical protein B0F87_1049 [Methylobacter tundripaludum]
MKEISAVESYKGSLADKGYEVQKDQVTRIQNRLKSFKTVRCIDLEGRPIDPEKRGPDGGLDLIIRIEAETPAAEKRVEKEVLKILLENDY